MPSLPRIRESVSVQPRTGDLFLFPSGLMHMVEPNITDKDRYSISFNCETNDLHSGLRIKSGKVLDEENADFVYEIDEFKGRPTNL